MILCGRRSYDDCVDAVIYLDVDASIKITLGDFEPTAAVPVQLIQMDGSLPGTYAGVEGSFRCRAPVETASRVSDQEGSCHWRADSRRVGFRAYQRDGIDP